MAEATNDREAQAALAARGPIPGHVAIIMDGNGRWARERGLPRVQGHQEGAASVRDIAEASAQLGIGHLTLYTFSTENWQRPAAEVSALMHLLIRTLRREVRTLHENLIRLNAIGDLDKLPAGARRELDEVMRSTRDNDRMTIHLALSYSGRWDLTEAARAVARAVADGRLTPDEVGEDVICRNLSTAGVPDPDLLIRTGGDIRISNFLLWQAAYSELFFTGVYWPSFRRERFYEAIRSFQDRDRRFGRVLDDVETTGPAQ
jgi:undecaprenyl diphosphate synthase